MCLSPTSQWLVASCCPDGAGRLDRVECPRLSGEEVAVFSLCYFGIGKDTDMSRKKKTARRPKQVNTKQAKQAKKSAKRKAAKKTPKAKIDKKAKPKRRSSRTRIGIRDRLGQLTYRAAIVRPAG